MTLQELERKAKIITLMNKASSMPQEASEKFIIELCKRFAREEVEKIEKAYEYDAEHGDMQDAHKTGREIQAIIKQLQ